MIGVSNDTVTGVPGPGAPLWVGTRSPFQSQRSWERALPLVLVMPSSMWTTTNTHWLQEAPVLSNTVDISGGSRHWYSTVSSFSVVRKMLIVPVCARAHHINIIWNQFRFLRATCLTNLKGSVGLILAKVSVMRISIPLDLSSRSFIPLPCFIRSRRPIPHLSPSLVLFPPCSV
jgi:hypothetical protein